MITKRFIADDMRQAIREVGKALGPEAVIISNSRVNGKIEIVATSEYDDAEMFKDQFSNPNDRYNYKNITKRKNDTKVDIIVPTESDTLATQDLIANTSLPNLPTKSDYPSPNELHLTDIQNELSNLRNLMEQQLSGLAWGDVAKRHPLRVKLIRHLIELGLSPSLSNAISENIPDDLNIKEAWEKAIDILIGKVLVIDKKYVEESRVITLVGPTGVGKTTTIAKLAARHALRHGRNDIALITTDCFRIGAHEQLRTYARILDIPIYTVSNEKELNNVICLVKDKDLVLVDSAGMSHRDKRLASQLDMLSQIPSKLRKTFLVISAATQYESLNESIRTFSKNTDGCILTKLDETANLGTALSVVVENRVPIAYISDGQRVPEDIHNANAENFVNQSISLMREMGRLEESLEKLLWSRSVNANV